MRALVVEDEPIVRHLIDKVLTRRGHHVIAATDPSEANALLLDYPGPLDVALLDVDLPGTDGLKYADHIEGQFPSARLIFMTGLTDEDRLVAAETRATLLLKPFTPDQLIAVIEAA